MIHLWEWSLLFRLLEFRGLTFSYIKVVSSISILFYIACKIFKNIKNSQTFLVYRFGQQNGQTFKGTYKFGVWNLDKKIDGTVLSTDITSKG